MPLMKKKYLTQTMLKIMMNQLCQCKCQMFLWILYFLSWIICYDIRLLWTLLCWILNICQYVTRFTDGSSRTFERLTVISVCSIQPYTYYTETATLFLLYYRLWICNGVCHVISDGSAVVLSYDKSDSYIKFLQLICYDFF